MSLATVAFMLQDLADHLTQFASRHFAGQHIEAALLAAMLVVMIAFGIAGCRRLGRIAELLDEAMDPDGDDEE
jgi:hypothetical protein